MIYNKWTVLISSMAMQLVLGIIYIWGVFQPEVAAYYGWSNTESAAVFSVMIAFIVAGSIIGGRFQDRLGPRPVIVVSGVLIGVGAYLASMTKTSPYFMYFTYGGIAGLGIGAIYTTTIAAVQKWFKEKKALATGLVLGALGFGGVVFTPMVQYLLKEQGVPATFRILSLIFAVICISGGMVVNNPKDVSEGTEGLQGMTNAEMLKTPMYYLVAGTMLLSLPAFFMVSPLIKTLCFERGISESLAVYVVMAVSVLNSAGRFAGTFISVRLGEKDTVLVLNVITVLSCVVMTFGQGVVFILAVCMLGISFGGFLGVFPVITSGLFGIKNAASNYGFVLIGYGVAAVFAPGIYGLTVGFGRAVPFAAAAIISVAAIITGRFIGEKYLGEDAK